MNGVVCGLLGLFMAVAHCPQHLPLRADRFGLIDAASSRNEMMGAIAIVNRILQGRANHKVMPFGTRMAARRIHPGGLSTYF